MRAQADAPLSHTSLPVKMLVSAKQMATLDGQEVTIKTASGKFLAVGDLTSALELSGPFKINAVAEITIMRETGVDPACIVAHEAAHVPITSLLDDAIKELEKAPAGTVLALDKRELIVNALDTHHLEWDLFAEVRRASSDSHAASPLSLSLSGPPLCRTRARHRIVADCASPPPRHAASSLGCWSVAAALFCC